MLLRTAVSLYSPFQSIFLGKLACCVSDNKITTRVNLFNEWVRELPEDARTPEGTLTDCAPCILNRNDSCISHLETIEITFHNAPPAQKPPTEKQKTARRMHRHPACGQSVIE